MSKQNISIGGNGSLEVKGNIFSNAAGTMTLNGGSPTRSAQWLVAPKSTLELKGNSGGYGYNVKGIVVVKSLTGAGVSVIGTGIPVIPNPAVPTHTPKKFVISTESNNPLGDEILIEID